MTDLSTKTNAQLFTIVVKGQESFFSMAFAILEIDKRKIWEKSHSSMAAFCEIKFGISTSDVSKLKGAARALLNLKEFPILPSNEGQAREIVSLKHAEPQRKVWKAVLELVEESKEPITARLIKETAIAVLGDSVSDAPAPEVTGVGQLVKVLQFLQDISVDDDQKVEALKELGNIEELLKEMKENWS